jgi:hypothetical protein
MLRLRDLVRITGCHASATDSSIHIAKTFNCRSGSVILLLELEEITSCTVIGCHPKGSRELDGTHNFRKADVVLAHIEIPDENATRTIKPLLV